MYKHKKKYMCDLTGLPSERLIKQYVYNNNKLEWTGLWVSPEYAYKVEMPLPPLPNYVPPPYENNYFWSKYPSTDNKEQEE